LKYRHSSLWCKAMSKTLPPADRRSPTSSSSKKHLPSRPLHPLGAREIEAQN